MHPANGEKIEPPKKVTLLPTTTPQDPEKQSLKLAEAKSQPDNMTRIQHFCFTLLILALLGLTIVSAASSRQGHAISNAIVQEKLRFQELLNSVEPTSLHEVLHTHLKDKYKHGVYQEDKHALEVVHQENAAVAHSLIELAKRQGGNGTVVVTTTGATVTETTTTATQTANPPPTTSDNSPPPSTSQSVPPTAPTTTAIQHTSSSPVQSTSSAPVSSTNVQSPSSGKVTPTPSRSVTQQVLYTSTLANGGVTTVTSLTVVPADQAQTAGTSTNTANASVQSNSATSVNAFSINGVLGALSLIAVFSGL